MNATVSDLFSKIHDEHTRLRREKDYGKIDLRNLASKETLANKAKELLQEIRLAGRTIKDANQRQQLESYALFWGRFITDMIQEYPNTSLLDPGSQVFHEEKFTLRDIYISLQTKSLDSNKNTGKTLDAWVENELGIDCNNNRQSALPQDYMLLLEGEPGLGKSSFCQMFADKIMQAKNPLYLPILIDLQEIKSLEMDLEATLKKNCPRVKLIDTSDEKKPRLFMLDGLDSLAIENHPEQSIEVFLTQIVKFCLHPERSGDRVLLTSRSSIIKQILAQPEIEKQISPHIKRVEIQAMDDELQETWITENWQKLVGEKTASDFRQFLNHQQAIKQLAQSPLILYLLAAMHRDSQESALKNEPLEIGDENAIIEVFDRMLTWTISKQLPEWIQTELKKGNREKNENDFRRIFTEAGLCAIQSGGIRSTMTLLNTRLTNRGNELAERLSRHILERKKSDQTTVLANYLHNTATECGGSLEFNHKSFCEFLYASRLLDGFDEWTKKWSDFKQEGKQKQYGPEEFVIPADLMDWEVYDLLGFGGLTPEIVFYINVHLENWKKDFPEEITKERLTRLFWRLKNFFYRWFEGDFINKEYAQTLAQRKMLQLQKSLEAQRSFLGRRQIDVYTGLNVLILLLELHRRLLDMYREPPNTKDIPIFYPCGKPLPHSNDVCNIATPSITDEEEFAPSRILRLINYSRWLGSEVFTKTVGPFLEGINLRGADLRGVEFAGVKLNHAYLSGATLNGINLSGAELNQAFLGNAKLSRANLNNTQLNTAFLGNADLSGAFLDNASLINAVLTGANLRTSLLVNANLQGAYFGDADLGDAKLKNAILEMADLSCSNLRDANLRGANLERAKLIGADLRDADMTNTLLKDGKLMGADLRGADLTGANLLRANFENAIGDDRTKIAQKALEQAIHVPDNWWEWFKNDKSLE